MPIVLGPRFSARPGRSTATTQGMRSRFTPGTGGLTSEADFRPGGPHRVSALMICAGGPPAAVGRFQQVTVDGRRLVDGAGGGCKQLPVVCTLESSTEL